MRSNRFLLRPIDRLIQLKKLDAGLAAHVFHYIFGVFQGEWVGGICNRTVQLSYSVSKGVSQTAAAAA